MAYAPVRLLLSPAPQVGTSQPGGRIRLRICPFGGTGTDGRETAPVSLDLPLTPNAADAQRGGGRAIGSRGSLTRGFEQRGADVLGQRWPPRAERPAALGRRPFQMRALPAAVRANDGANDRA